MISRSPDADQLDINLMRSRRAMAVSQEHFAGGTLRVAAEAAEVGWHSTGIHPEAGAVALVREDGDFVGLVGEIIKVSRSLPTETRAVYVYVLGTANVPFDISLARRPFMELGLLANEQLACAVEVVA